MYRLYYLILLVCPSLYAQTNTSMELPSEIRESYQNHNLYNTGGSCVFMSLGLVGVHMNNDNAASCPWPSQYGPENVGGGWPSRVAEMAKKRDLSIYNVTASDYGTMKKWFDWASANNKFFAFGAGRSHFQTGYSRDEKEAKWGVCNNNSPGKIDIYSENGFKNLHEASGYWAVFLKGHSTPPTPQYYDWWSK
jgi:hypothetical protein